jgi:hypothetical protein
MLRTVCVAVATAFIAAASQLLSELARTSITLIMAMVFPFSVSDCNTQRGLPEWLANNRDRLNLSARRTSARGTAGLFPNSM